MPEIEHMDPMTVAGALNGLLLAIGLLLGGLRYPKAWCLLGVLLIGGGTGLLVWGIVAASTGEVTTVASPAAIIGSGAGSLAGGIAFLVVSLIQGCKRPTSGA